MRVLLAFDKFKDALTAAEACATGRAILRAQHPDWETESCPLADGGEGFVRVLTGAADGRLRQAVVTGPRGHPVVAIFGLVPAENIPEPAARQLGFDRNRIAGGLVAVIELAAASGLALLRPEERDPWETSTRGTGELIRHAAESGAIAIVLGVGGSATNDLGLGALSALGFAFGPSVSSGPLGPAPRSWAGTEWIAGQLNVRVPPVFIACDVTNPLLGLRGAVAVYGPQKGLCDRDAASMEDESQRMAQLLCALCGQPETLMLAAGSGAAGGTAFGLMTALHARLLPGFSLVSAWIDLQAKMNGADIVITGEGSFDASSLEGKGPGTLVEWALALGKPVYVFAGRVTAPARRGVMLHSITPEGTPLAQALNEARTNLECALREAFPPRAGSQTVLTT